MTNCKLSARGLGLAAGVIWGLSVLITGLLAHFFDYGTAFVTSMGTMYIGYGPTIGGSFIGGLFGFIDGLIGGAILAWLYNCFARDCGCCVKTTTAKKETKKKEA